MTPPVDKTDIGLDTIIGLYEREPEVYREKEIFGLLNVTFEHDEPELIIPVPMVPG